MQQAPGARPNLDVGGSTTNAQPAFRAFGQQGQSWQSVDGVVTANPKSDTQSGNYVDYSILEEATIQTIGHDASIPTRGIAINSIVKTGSNNFHGSGFFSGTSHRFESNNIDDALKAQGISAGNTLQLRDDTSADLGGRIVRDRLWFYVAARSRRDHNGILECFTPDGSGCVETQMAWFLTHKETLQLNASNRFTGFTMFNKRSDVEGMSRLVAWESRRNQRGFNGAWKTEWEGVKGRSIVASLMVGGFWNHSGGYGEEYGGGKPATTDSVTRVVTGTSTTMNERNFEDRLQARGSAELVQAGLGRRQSRDQDRRRLLQDPRRPAPADAPRRIRQLPADFPERRRRSDFGLQYAGASRRAAAHRWAATRRTAGRSRGSSR